MTKVAVIGATGQIARYAIPMLAEADAQLTLFARSASRVEAPEGAQVIEGDATDEAALTRAVEGQDVVYANLGGNIDDQAKTLVRAMDAAGTKRLVFILAGGIYREMPEPFESWNEKMLGEYLDIYRRAGDAVEASDLDWTIIRPAWLTDYDEVDYELTQRDETFKGTEVSRKSVASLVTDIAMHPERHSMENIGVDKPGTDGPKPAFY